MSIYNKNKNKIPFWGPGSGFKFSPCKLFFKELIIFASLILILCLLILGLIYLKDINIYKNIFMCLIKIMCLIIFVLLPVYFISIRFKRIANHAREYKNKIKELDL